MQDFFQEQFTHNKKTYTKTLYPRESRITYTMDRKAIKAETYHKAQDAMRKLRETKIEDLKDNLYSAIETIKKSLQESRELNIYPELQQTAIHSFTDHILYIDQEDKELLLSIIKRFENAHHLAQSY